MNKQSITARIILILAIIVVVNVLSTRLFVRLDFTADKRYTLSKSTENILKNLDEPVTVTAYFSEDLPPNLAKTRRDFKELLVEYNNASRAKVAYEFVDPTKDQEVEQRAMRDGIQPILVSAREKDQIKQQRAFLGAVVEKGNNMDAIPYVQPGAAMEYALSSSIKKVSVSRKPKVGFLIGHGEPPLAHYQQVIPALRVLYDIREVDLDDTALNMQDYKTLIIVSPDDSVPAYQLNMLDAFIGRGGNILFAYDNVDGQMNQAKGVAVNTNFEEWIEEKGIRINNDFIVDNQSTNVGVRQQQGQMTFTTRVKFPYIPVITNFPKHPINTGLEEVMMPFVSSLTFVGDTSKVQFRSIATSSQNSGTATPPLTFDINKQWNRQDFPLDYLPVGATLEGSIRGNVPSRMVVFSDGDFPVNGPGRQAQQLNEDNVNLFVNAVDWLSDDTGLIELRTKGVTSRPLDQVEDSTKTLLKWLNFFVPIILIILYGIIRFQRSRNRRIKRMEEGYV